MTVVVPYRLPGEGRDPVERRHGRDLQIVARICLPDWSVRNRSIGIEIVLLRLDPGFHRDDGVGDGSTME